MNNTKPQLKSLKRGSQLLEFIPCFLEIWWSRPPHDSCSFMRQLLSGPASSRSKNTCNDTSQTRRVLHSNLLRESRQSVLDRVPRHFQSKIAKFEFLVLTVLTYLKPFWINDYFNGISAASTVLNIEDCINSIKICQKMLTCFKFDDRC